MIHLFGKVYLAPDELVDIQYDRVVISSQFGLEMFNKYNDIAGGDLVDYATNLNEILTKYRGEFIEFVQFLHEYSTRTGLRVIIFADDLAFNQILANWLKTLLPDLSEDQAQAIYSSIAFKFNAFNAGERSTLTTTSTKILPFQDFRPFYNSVRRVATTPHLNDVFKRISGSFGVEYMIASYLSSGAFETQLKNTMLMMYKKSLEVLLTDLKEAFLASLTNPKFCKKLNLNKVYTMATLPDVLHDDSEFAQLFTSKDLWNLPWSTHVSSRTTGGNLRVTGLTADHVSKFKRFIDVCIELTVVDENWNQVTKREEILLDYLKVFTEFDTKTLNEMLERDYRTGSVQSTFFPINLETVNNYLIREIYNNYYGDRNLDSLRGYVIRKFGG